MAHPSGIQQHHGWSAYSACERGRALLYNALEIAGVFVIASIIIGLTIMKKASDRGVMMVRNESAERGVMMVALIVILSVVDLVLLWQVVN